MNELRITDTNSSNDSKGRAFGLEGNNFLYVVGAFVAALGLYLLLNVLLHVQILIAVSLALPVLILPSAWVLFFRHNRPDGYAQDLVDSLLNKEGWGFSSELQPRLHHEDKRP